MIGRTACDAPSSIATSGIRCDSRVELADEDQAAHAQLPHRRQATSFTGASANSTSWGSGSYRLGGKSSRS